MFWNLVLKMFWKPNPDTLILTFLSRIKQIKINLRSLKLNRKRIKTYIILFDVFCMLKSKDWAIWLVHVHFVHEYRKTNNDGFAPTLNFTSGSFRYDWILKEGQGLEKQSLTYSMVHLHIFIKTCCIRVLHLRLSITSSVLSTV